MLVLLRGISLPYLRRHWLTALLNLTAIALGVGVFVAIQLSASSLELSFSQTIDRIAGKTQLEVSAGDAGLPEETVEVVRAVPGVAAAQPIIEVVARPEGLEESSMLVLGIDFLGDLDVRDWEFDDEEVLDDPLLFLAQPDSLCITEAFGARHGLTEGDTLRLETGLGPRRFVVRGLLKAEGPATAFGGNLALMDLYAAQHMFGRGRRFDRVDVTLEPGLSLDEGREQLRAALGEGFGIHTPARRGTQMEALIGNFAATLSLSSWQAIFIAVFLIFNGFAVAATRRRREIGVLRALGVSRRQIGGLFVLEGAILGLTGAVLGIAAGRLLAGGAMRFMIELTEMAYGVTHVHPVLLVDPKVIGQGLLLGLLSSVGAALLPARAAASVPPVEALARGRFQRFSEGQSRLRRWAGMTCLLSAVAVVLTLAPRSLPGAILGLFLINLAALFLAPSLISLLVAALRPALDRVFGAEGRIAADSLASAPRRTSATVLALMISVAFVLNLAGMAHAFRSSYQVWMDGVINADFYVSASERLLSQDHLLPAEFEGLVAEIPGVRWVEPFRGIHVEYGGRTPMLAALPLEKTFRRMEFPPVDVVGDEWIAGASRGEGAFVSDNFARLYGIGAGDTLVLPTPTGNLSLPVLAVVTDYTSDQGTIWLDRAVYVDRWGDDRISMLDVMLERGADEEAVAAAMRQRLADRTDRLFIMTQGEFKQIIDQVLDQFFSLAYAQLVIALVVAVLGITNTLVIAVTERGRELGILKALGTGRWQVAALVVLEALGIACCGGLLGYLLGGYLIRYSLDSISRNFNGWVLPFAFPWDIALGMVPLLVAVTVLAALYPARLAVRIPPARALEFE